jgi:tight adherence protein B
MIATFAVIAFLAGFLLVFGINLFWAANQQLQRERMREQLLERERLLQRERARVSAAHRDLYELAAESATELQGSRPLRERIGIFVEQTGTKITPAQVGTLAFFGGAGGGALVYLLTATTVLAVAAAAAGFAAPVLWVQTLRAMRMKKMLSQLPDAFDMMSRTMRAGQTFMQAMQSVAEEGSPPLATEFAYCYDQQYLGMSVEAALRDLARRTGLLELRIFVLAVLVHRQTGGNLSELLDKLSRVIRERYRVAGVISSLTAEGRVQAYVLLGLPVALFLAMYVINREYAQLLIEAPSLLMTTAGFMLFGALWMKKIINFGY